MNAHLAKDKNIKICLQKSLQINGKYLAGFSLEDKDVSVKIKLPKKKTTKNNGPTPSEINQKKY